jgi:hypothetical protein
MEIVFLTATAVEDEIVPYFPRIIEILKVHLTEEQSDEMFCLQLQAVGKQITVCSLSFLLLDLSLTDICAVFLRQVNTICYTCWSILMRVASEQVLQFMSFNTSVIQVYVIVIVLFFYSVL